MNISLTPQLKALVDQKVASGRYNSASEVIREALRALEDQDRLREQLRLRELRRDLDLGLEDLKHGRSSAVNKNTLKEIRAEGRKKMASLKAKKAL